MSTSKSGIIKPISKRTQRIILKKEPQATEGAKHAILIKGRKTSISIRNLMKDLHKIKKPHSTLLNKNNDVTIFENVIPVEKLCRKYEAGMFLLGSHTKKRPNNLIIGRLFNYELLDMIELGIESYKGLEEFCSSKVLLGVKPCLVFNGNWDDSSELRHLKSLFIDFFHKEDVESINIRGVEHTISFNILPNGKIYVRCYKIVLKKSKTGETPRVELEEIGPRFDFTLRRNKLPTDDLWKQACRRHDASNTRERASRSKNISIDDLGNRKGRIHVGGYNLMKLTTIKRKMK